MWEEWNERWNKQMKQRKLLSLLLAAVMVLAMLVPAAATGTKAPAPGSIVILHTNDVHCSIDQSVEEDNTVSAIGYAGVAALKAEMEDLYGEDYVTLVDAGDAIQGGPIGTLSKGSYIVDIMNQTGYDIAIPGNHEFDYGMDNFLTLAKDKAKYTYVCSNFVDLTTNKPVFDAYKLVTYGDTKVAYVGIDTPETFTKSTPTYFQDAGGKYIYSFSQGNEGKDLYEAVQKAVDAAKAEGADYVVALGHLGVDSQSSPWMSTEVVANTTGIDVLIDGHSHSTLGETAKNKDGEDVILAQTGTKLAAVGKIVIDPAKDEITHELVTNYSAQDEATAAFVKGINDEFESVLQKVVAKSDVELTTKDPATGERAVRSAETNLGDLCADAYRVMLGADVAFVNGGGVRADIAAGDITYEDIINVHPFGNEACLVEATGQQILDALEMGSRSLPDENGGFLQVSGLSYTVDLSVPSSVVLNDEKEFVKVDGDYRVKDVTVGDQPLELDKTYTLASHNYMLKSGGDGFVMFKENTLLKDCVMIDNQVLINYIVDELDGVVGSGYAKPAGRITIVGEAAPEQPGKPEAPSKYPADVTEGAWFYDAAAYVLDNGIMNGTGVGFEPNGTVTRGTVYQTLYNLVGRPAVAEAATFTDVAGTWYADAAAWAEDTGLTTGTGSGAFSGDRAMTRQELAKVFAEYAAGEDIKPEAPADLSAFTDSANVAGWAKEGMETAVALGILKGNNNALNPTGTAIRAELAQIFLNYSALEPAPATYTETAVQIEVPEQDGVPAHIIDGVLTLPVGEGPFPAVVMLHGTGSNKDEAGNGYAMAAPQMAEAGLASLRIDFMGTAASKADDYRYYSYTSANIDAKAAAGYLAGLEQVFDEQISVMGWSQGGTNALLAAAAYPETFSAVVTWAGALDLTGLFGETSFADAKAKAEADGAFTMTLDWRTPSDLPVGVQWFKDVESTDVLAETAKIKAPVLAIHGEDDDTVPPASAGQIAEAAADGQTHMIPGCDHTFNVFSGDFTALNDSVKATTDFILGAYAEAQQAA